MKPVDQAVFADKEGDCFAACIASIIEADLPEVPNFRITDPDDMSGAAKRWLAPRGWAMLPICFPSLEQLRATYFDFPCWCIVGGPSPRKDADGTVRRHAVVCHTGAHNDRLDEGGGGYGVRMVHDPHPSRSFHVEDDLKNYRWVWLLVRC